MKSQNKKIPTSIQDSLNDLGNGSKVLFFDLWLKSNCAGIAQNTYGKEIEPLFKLGLIQPTKDHIVLNDYLSSNYGKQIKEDYNPHKPVLHAIEDAALSYDIDSNKIIVPDSMLLTDFSSLDKLKPIKSSIDTNKQNRKPVEPRNTIIENLGSIKFALVLAALLTVAQSFHTGYSLFLISDLPEPYNLMFAVGAAILLDALIIYFVAIGSIKNSLVFLCFSTLMNVFALHHSPDIQYFQYNSYFALMVAFIIPYSIHAVASQINLSKTSTNIHPKAI